MRNVNFIRWPLEMKINQKLDSTARTTGLENKPARYLMNMYGSHFDGVSGVYSPDFWEHEIKNRLGLIYGRIHNQVMFLR